MIFVDIGLVSQIKSGDRKAMHQLYTLTARYLYAIIQRYLVNEDDVHDVMQETYIKVFGNINDFNPKEGASFMSWISRIAVHEALMYLRQKQRESFLVPMCEVPDQEAEFEVARFSPDEIQSAILQLPTGYRVVLNLFVFEGKSHREISQLLGIKEASSASQLNRAKHLLRKILLKQEGGKQ